MTRPQDRFEQAYTSALRTYLATPDESARDVAYRIGRAALDRGRGLVDLASVHGKALAALLDDGEAAVTTASASEFLLECLSPLEMAFRGFWEANRSLRQLNQQLEQQVRREVLLARTSGTLARAGRDPDRITAASLREMVGDFAAGAAMCVPSADGRRLIVTSIQPGAQEDDEAPIVHRQILVDDPGPAQHVFATGEPILLPTIEGEPSDRLREPVAGLFEHSPACPTLWLPITSAMQTLGVLMLSRPVGGESFTDHDVRIATEVTNRTALAMENARLFAERERAEQQFRETFDKAPTGIATVGLEPESLGRVLSANSACSRLTGYDHDALLQMSVLDVVAPSERKRVHRWLRNGPSRASTTAELRCLRADNTVIDIRVSVAEIAAGDTRALAILHIEDVTERKRLEQELTERALYDDLTGLANRRLLMDRLQMSLEQRRRHGSEVALVFCDIDRFKDINDSLGHSAGDDVLVEVARRLRAETRRIDTVSRLAGDEFIVLCPGVADASTATLLADRIHSVLTEPMQLPTGELRLGVSIGVAVTGAAPSEPERLIQAADSAMYHAKRGGRDHWELFTDAVQHQAAHRHETEQRLRAGLDHDRFELLYQPVVDLRDQRIVGVEALLRLNDDEHGLLTPDTFIEVAEDSEIIIPIGKWVLQTACRQAAEWNRRFGAIQVSVNLSARQAARPHTIDHIHEALRTAALDPRQLCLEMTERVLIESGDSITKDLQSLVSDGLTLALDDFGTGYSSLVYLKRFPISEIKIDRTFVADLPRDAADRAIVRAITGLAHELNLFTVAEGIENSQQLALLKELQCDWAQGFMLHCPLPAQEVTRLLQKPPTSTRPTPPENERESSGK